MAVFLATEVIMERMEFQVSRSESALNKSQCLKSENLVLRKPGTEHLNYVLRASPAVLIYAVTYGWIQQLLFHLTCKRRFLVILLTSVRLLQSVLDDSQAKAQIPYQMSVPTGLKAQLYFHAIALLSREVGKKKLNIFQKAVNTMLVVLRFYLRRRPGMRSQRFVRFGHCGFR